LHRLSRLGVTRCQRAGKSKVLAQCGASRSHCLIRASKEIRAAPGALLLAACVLSPPYLSAELTLPYELGDRRVLENPCLVLRQRRNNRTGATYGDDKSDLREHLSLQLTTPCSS